MTEAHSKVTARSIHDFERYRRMTACGPERARRVFEEIDAMGPAGLAKALLDLHDQHRPASVEHGAFEWDDMTGSRDCVFIDGHADFPFIWHAEWYAAFLMPGFRTHLEMAADDSPPDEMSVPIRLSLMVLEPNGRKKEYAPSPEDYDGFACDISVKQANGDLWRRFRLLTPPLREIVRDLPAANHPNAVLRAAIKAAAPALRGRPQIAGMLDDADFSLGAAPAANGEGRPA
ncbi:MAG: hypothetical protein IBJ15_00210 [Alphaproteobacteria bacterium]|nr:hypothetical protein [Alphaproteobacteria bacterium]